MPYIIQIPAGGEDNFSYIIGDSAGVALIDPAFGEANIEAQLKAAPGPLKYIINTHGHCDHTALNRVFQDRYGACVLVHESGLAGRISALKQAIRDNDEIALGAEAMRFVHTPGHTEDSMVVLYGNGLFTGDTLFASEDCGKLGRRDEDCLARMFESMQKINAMPGELRVYSGHRYGDRDWTTLEYEKKHNPALLCRTLDDFRKFKKM